MDSNLTDFEYNGFFVPKPRMTRRDQWAKRPIVLRYYEFKDQLNLVAKSKGFTLGDRFKITFEIPVHPSWSEKTKRDMIGKPHQRRPDLDNLLKAVMDAFMKQDATVHYVIAKKVWSDKSRIVILNFDNS